MEAVRSDEHSILKDYEGLSSLTDENLDKISETIRPFRLPKGGMLQADLEQGWLIFLVHGRVTLINAQDERVEFVDEGSERAYQPVFSDSCAGFQAAASSEVDLIRIDRLHVDVLLSRQLNESTDVNEVSFEEMDTEVFASILEAQESGTLQVPSLPEVAMAINAAANDENMDFQRFAAVVQRDPPCTARLIQIANSPSYRGNVDVESLSGAISRLGMDGARNMIMAIAVEQMVNGVHPLAIQSLRNFYHEAGEVAALCFVMAKQSGCVREERAYMAGLLHALGTVPLVSHACEALAPDPDMQVVERVCAHLVEPVSSWLLNEWSLDANLCDAAEYASDWHRSVEGDVGLVEFVIAARMLRFVAKGQSAPADIPATDIGQSLIAVGIDLSDPEVFLNNIQDDLEAARQLLG